MTEYHQLRTRIQDLISAQEEKKNLEKKQTESQMKKIEETDERLKVLASKVMSETILPCLEVLEECFDDVRIQPPSSEHWVSILFNTEQRYPATVMMDLGVSVDPVSGKLHLVYRFRITPILMEYQGEDTLSLGLEAFDKAKACAFVEEKVFQASRAYLELQNHPAYLKENLVTDPVCGMTVNRAQAASVEYQGKTYYFCVDACRERFLKDPVRYTGSGSRR